MQIHTRRTVDPAQRRERGLSFVLVAILSIVIIGFIGLALDASHVAAVGTQLQNAADASALAAAQKVHSEGILGGSLGTYTVTRSAATSCAALNIAADNPVQLQSNPSNDSQGDIVVGTWDVATKAFTPTLVMPNAVKVTARMAGDLAAGPLPLVFGGLFGTTTSDISRTAIASLQAKPEILIHVLNPNQRGSLSLSGNGVLDVGAGSVQVDSSHSCAVSVNGNPSICAVKTLVHGNACVPSGCVEGELEQNAPVEPDPLANVLPTVADWNAVKAAMPSPLGLLGKVTMTTILTPGYYPKGLDINNSTTVTLLPGTYMFGETFAMNGQSLVTAGAGVTLLMDKHVKLDVGGGASLLLTPPVSGPYKGLTIMFHRQTTDAKACSIGGNGVIDFLGTMYCPSGGIDLQGIGGMQSFGAFVCDTLSCGGTPTITGLGVVPQNTSGTVYLVK